MNIDTVKNSAFYDCFFLTIGIMLKDVDKTWRNAITWKLIFLFLLSDDRSQIVSSILANLFLKRQLAPHQ